MKKSDNKIWRVGTLNLQAGLKTNKFGDYITNSFHHVSPVGQKKQNIKNIAPSISHLDVFGVQEVDPGSWRSGFLDQTRWLAEHAGFPYWSHQANRNLRLSVTANAMLSKHPLLATEHWTLPSKNKETSPRGAIRSSFALGSGASAPVLTCVVAHFSLSAQDRLSQASFLAERIKDEKNIIVMGDFNALATSNELAPLLNVMDGFTSHKTYPRWSPQRAIDVMWWKGLEIVEENVHQWGVTDHCGLEVAFKMPSAKQPDSKQLLSKKDAEK